MEEAEGIFYKQEGRYYVILLKSVPFLIKNGFGFGKTRQMSIR